jgi:hypothetical protein
MISYKMKNMTEGDLSVSTLYEQPSDILNQDVVCLNTFLRTPSHFTGWCAMNEISNMAGCIFR